MKLQIYEIQRNRDKYISVKLVYVPLENLEKIEDIRSFP